MSPESIYVRNLSGCNNLEKTAFAGKYEDICPMLRISDCSKYSHVRIPLQIPPIVLRQMQPSEEYIFSFVLSYKYQQYIDYNLDHTEPNNELVNNNSASHVGVPLLCTQKGVLKILTFLFCYVLLVMEMLP